MFETDRTDSKKLVKSVEATARDQLKQVFTDFAAADLKIISPLLVDTRGQVVNGVLNKCRKEVAKQLESKVVRILNISIFHRIL